MTTSPPFNIHNDPSLTPWSQHTLSTYLATDPFSPIVVDGMGTSILVISPSPLTVPLSISTTTSSSIATPTPRLLILRRALSDSMPGQWEAPGGGVDASDASVLAAAARELFEETGLSGPTFLRAVPTTTTTTTTTTPPRVDSWFLGRSGTKRWGKVCFLATVDDILPEALLDDTNNHHDYTNNRDDDNDRGLEIGGGARRDPDEHMDGFWASEEECVRRIRESTGEVLEFTSNYPTVLEGFRVWREMVAERQAAAALLN